MYDSKLITLLQSFSSNEWKQFNRYLQSPFLNENQEIIILFDYIRKNIKKKRKGLLQKQVVFRVVYPRKRYTDDLMRQLMYNLHQAAEDFLAFQRYQNDKFTRNCYLAEIYDTRDMEKHFQQVIRQLEKKRDKQKVFDVRFYEENYRIEELKSLFLEKQKNRKQELNLQEVTNKLDHYYLITKLRFSCLMTSYQHLFKFKYELFLLEDILKHLREKDYSEVPAIKIYHPLLESLLDPENETHFQQFKAALPQYEQRLTKDSRLELYALARNYCIKQLNKGKTTYIRELFDFYKMALEQDILWKGDYLSTWTYNNIVAVGLKLQEFEWTKQFIEEYGAALPEEKQEGTHTFCMARVHFKMEEYDKVIHLLHQTEIDDVFLNLSAKTILLKTYFELEEEEALYSLLDSFKMYIFRKKESISYHQDNYLQIIRFTRKLANLNPYDKEARQALQAEVKAEKRLREKGWFLRKLDTRSV